MREVRRLRGQVWMAVITLAATLAAPAAADLIFDLQAVDANGNPTHPLVGAGPTIFDPPDVPHPEDPTRVTIEGIALNSPNDLTFVNAPSGFRYWQIYVQSETDPAGIAVWQGSPWMPSWPPSYPAVNAGDRVRVNGFVAQHRGKSNINSRHSGAPLMDFIVEVLEPGAGMPDPVVIPSIADCNYFSPDRLDVPGSRGGEFYQAQWCMLQNVFIVDPPAGPPPWGSDWGWGANKVLMVSDASGETFPLYLSQAGDFDSYAPPEGYFSVVGIFDQEDPAAPLVDNYRLWVLRNSDITLGAVPEPLSASLLVLGLGALAARQRARHKGGRGNG